MYALGLNFKPTHLEINTFYLQDPPVCSLFILTTALALGVGATGGPRISRRRRQAT